MALDLIVVRHGRTDWNREIRFRGRTDLPLDEMGRAQAQAAAWAIRERWAPVAAIYASPLQRARQTAEPIAQALGRPVQVHPGLLDIDYGDWTGLTPSEVEAQDPKRYQLWQTNPQFVQFPQGETLSAVQSRLLCLVDETAQRHAGQTVVLVGHLVVNRVLLCSLLGLDLGGFWRLAQDPGALNLVRYEDGTSQVLCLNDTCHLQASGLQGGIDVREQETVHLG